MNEMLNEHSLIGRPRKLAMVEMYKDESFDQHKSSFMFHLKRTQIIPSTLKTINVNRQSSMLKFSCSHPEHKSYLWDVLICNQPEIEVEIS